FWLQKGVVPSWAPGNRWECPSYKMVYDLPETEWYLWLARIVDGMEKSGQMLKFKTLGNQHNPYREQILDFTCMEAFGSKYPTKEGVYWKQG
ncbi:MAG: hypothetical protein ACKPKO_21390, partial [Candidatus Fonsibacter sp.]